MFRLAPHERPLKKKERRKESTLNVAMDAVVRCHGDACEADEGVVGHRRHPSPRENRLLEGASDRMVGLLAAQTKKS